ncbi:dimeric dUTPase (all-alpha-NTP-PPase superfamily) [Bacillus oleivorans]|uniref:Dimeric dUTPase (All-alpha-NTP-PPase superfamily) n=1 Tax=Bacillus oleivorans TaxID=1448271 RepID=A0A285D7S7_9BACI|nr:dUTP diphosphatase [Bacillus oleivorans]SNX75862.1 dimeric dUTPase (all-alpha-NTP-PPase superfamily) [Bacillus oleivorans]
MNLSKLFEAQAELDKRIVKEKGLEGQDLLPKKILALQVELGELANEWRGFKFWSEDQRPRISKTEYIKGVGLVTTNPLLEEYVDCLHFILSIGNEYGYKNEPTLAIVPDNVLDQLNDLFKIVAYMDNLYKDMGYGCGVHDFYDDLLGNFMNLGKLLGFTCEQIEQAYFEKNKINHGRQENGY